MQDHSDASTPPMWELVLLEDCERPRGFEGSKIKRRWTALKQTLEDVALTSPYLQIDEPVTVQEKPWGTQYRLRAYPIDPRQQFRFKADLTVRGKAALARIGVAFAATPTTARESA